MVRGSWMGIAVLGVLGSASSLVAQETNEHRPVYSPSGDHVVFMLQAPETGGDWELFVSDPSGAHARRLTHHEGWDGYAVISPDGARLVFDRGLNGDADKQPHVLHLASGETALLGSYDGWLSVSGWSDKHGLLAFWEKDGQRDLYLFDEKGAVNRRLTNTPSESEHDAHFSPDGDQIVFASGPAEGESQTTLEIMDASGDNRRVVVESKGRIYGASWSPDGSRIGYTDAPDGENGDVFVLHVGTGEVERITADPSWDHMPVWSPDGATLLFSSYRTGTERIYALALDTGVIQRWRAH